MEKEKQVMRIRNNHIRGNARHDTRVLMKHLQHYVNYLIVERWWMVV